MTSLIRFSPTGDLRRMQREIDRLFDDFFPARGRTDAEAEAATWTPRVDLAETEDAYLIHLDVPGMKKEDFHINIQEGQLTVTGERKQATRDEAHNYVRVERRYGHFFRAFTLPKAVQEDAIEAAYEAGELVIRVPKAEETKPRRIEIR